MKLEDHFEISDYKNCGTGYGIREKPRLIDKPISELIEALKQTGANIDETNSEVSYQRNGGSSKGKIPLQIYLGTKPDAQQTLMITGYSLRGKNLEIKLNYNIKSDAPKKFDRHTRIGPSHIESSLKCDLRFTGEYKEGEIIEKVKEKIQAFYSGMLDIANLAIPTTEELEEIGRDFREEKK